MGRADHQIAYKRKAAPTVTSTPLEDWTRWVNQVGRASVASKFVEFEAKVAELEERNANQTAEIAKLRKQVETRDAQIEELTAAGIAKYHEAMAKPTNAVRPHPLEQWWMDKAQAEVEPLIAKMTEYGGEGRAFDLIDIGQALIDANVNFPGTFGVGQVQELGIYFYLVGKFARWKAAVSEGRSVSDDTLLDIGIYVRMAQRIREVGGWPS
jgi:uncharacterized coiled-coil protein SlyX